MQLDLATHAKYCFIMIMMGLTREEIASFTVVSLKTELRNLGLPAQGNKEVLVDRLVRYYLQPDNETGNGAVESTSTPVPIPRRKAVDVGDISYQGGYVWDNQHLLSADDHIGVQPVDHTALGDETVPLEIDTTRLQMKKIKNMFKFFMDQSALRHPGKLTKDLKSVLAEANKIVCFQPQLIGELEAMKQNVSLELSKASLRQKVIEDLEESIDETGRLFVENVDVRHGSLQTLVPGSRDTEGFVDRIIEGKLCNYMKKQEFVGLINQQIATAKEEIFGDFMRLSGEDIRDLKIELDTTTTQQLDNFKIDLNKRLQHYEQNMNSLAVLAQLSNNNASKINTLMARVDGVCSDLQNVIQNVINLGNSLELVKKKLSEKCLGCTPVQLSGTVTLPRSSTASEVTLTTVPLGLGNMLPTTCQEQSGTFTPTFSSFPQPSVSTSPLINTPQNQTNHSSEYYLPGTPQPVSGELSSGQHQRVTLHKHYRCINRLQTSASELKEIFSKNIEAMSKTEFLEFVAYDETRSKELCDTFNAATDEYTKFDLDDMVSNSTILNMEKIILDWKKRVDSVKKSHFLHLKTGDSLLKKVDLSSFTGDVTGDTIYEFQEVFSQLADTTLNPTEKANLLFKTYLSDKIKAEVQGLKGDYEGMMKHLIKRYGDVRIICEQHVKRLEEICHPKNNPVAKSEYYKKVEAVLIQLESLTSASRADCVEARNALYNIGFVNKIVGKMPEQFINSFCKSSGYENLPGDQSFRALLFHVRDYFRTSDNIIRVKSLEEHGSKKGTANVACESSVSRTKRQRSGKAACKSGHSLSWPCQVCPGKPSHEFGYCSSFWSGNNYKRRFYCRNNNICFVCFRADCYQTNRRSCTTLPSLAPSLICTGCRGNYPDKPSNWLTCPIDHHPMIDFEQLEKDLVRYLKVFDTSYLQKLQNTDLKPEKAKDQKANTTLNSSNLLCQICQVHPSVCKCNRDKKPTESFSSPFNPKQPVTVFDPNTGNQLPVPEEKIHRYNDEHAVYIFQMLRIGGEDILVFYDSGASIHCIRGALAEKMKLKVVTAEADYLGSIGGGSLWTSYGTYKVMLKDLEGWHWELEMQGMKRVTNFWPMYEWDVVNSELRQHKEEFMNEVLPTRVGGREVDLLIGIKASALSPVLLCTLPSGISVFRCKFQDLYGSTLAFGGSH